MNSEKLKEVENYIHEIKAGAKILHTQYGAVPLPLILDTQLTPQQEYISIAEADAHKEHHHEHEHHHHHSDHLENDGFISISFQSDRPFDVHKFEAFLSEEMPAGVFRAKGIVWFNDSELRHIFQLSGYRYNLHADDWYSQPKNQLVFIGRNLNPSEINSHLHKCLV